MSLIIDRYYPSPLCSHYSGSYQFIADEKKQDAYYHLLFFDVLGSTFRLIYYPMDNIWEFDVDYRKINPNKYKREYEFLTREYQKIVWAGPLLKSIR